MTLSLILAAASETSAAAPGVVEGLKQTFGHFGVEWRLVLIQLSSFLIVLGVLYKFLVKPVVTTMEERANKIGTGLKYAEEMQAKLAAAQQESTVIVKKSQIEGPPGSSMMPARPRRNSSTAKRRKRRSNRTISSSRPSRPSNSSTGRCSPTPAPRSRVSSSPQPSAVLAKKLTDADRSAYNDAATRELSNV